VKIRYKIKIVNKKVVKNVYGQIKIDKKTLIRKPIYFANIIFLTTFFQLSTVDPVYSKWVGAAKSVH
jgi:hypothetical protein